jgi:hypothetical protein
MNADKDNSKYARNVLLQDPNGGDAELNTLFTYTKSLGTKYTLNPQCNLLDKTGNMAYANPASQSDSVTWYDPFNPPADSDKEPITCGLSGDKLDNMQCLSGSNIYNAFNTDASQTTVWNVTVDYRLDLFAIYVTPTV